MLSKLVLEKVDWNFRKVLLFVLGFLFLFLKRLLCVKYTCKFFLPTNMPTL